MSDQAQSQCEGNEPYALMVLGDSMLPEFKEGDIIIIEPSGVIANESYVIAYHNDEYIFRQLIIDDDKFYLKPLNESYTMEEISGLDVIKGKITQKKFSSKRKDIKFYA